MQQRSLRSVRSREPDDGYELIHANVRSTIHRLGSTGAGIQTIPHDANEAGCTIERGAPAGPECHLSDGA